MLLHVNLTTFLYFSLLKMPDIGTYMFTFTTSCIAFGIGARRAAGMNTDHEHRIQLPSVAASWSIIAILRVFKTRNITLPLQPPHKPARYNVSSQASDTSHGTAKQITLISKKHSSPSPRSIERWQRCYLSFALFLRSMQSIKISHGDMISS